MHLCICILSKISSCYSKSGKKSYNFAFDKLISCIVVASIVCYQEIFNIHRQTKFLLNQFMAFFLLFANRSCAIHAFSTIEWLALFHRNETYNFSENLCLSLLLPNLNFQRFPCGKMNKCWQREQRETTRYESQAKKETEFEGKKIQ